MSLSIINSETPTLISFVFGIIEGNRRIEPSGTSTTAFGFI